MKNALKFLPAAIFRMLVELSVVRTLLLFCWQAPVIYSSHPNTAGPTMPAHLIGAQEIEPLMLVLDEKLSTSILNINDPV